MTTKQKYSNGNEITESLSRRWPFISFLFWSNFTGFTFDFPQNLELARMRAYSVSARNTKASLVMIQTSRGLRLAETVEKSQAKLIFVIYLNFVLVQEIVVDLYLLLGQEAPNDEFIFTCQVWHLGTWKKSVRESASAF